MNVHTGRVIVMAITVALLSACSSNPNNEDKEQSSPPPVASSLSPVVTPRPPAPSTPATAPFDTTVYISDDFPGERWLPTQFTPQLVTSQSVSLFNKWPLDGDTVHVLCQTEGEGLQDGLGVPTKLWFGILVPTKQAMPEAHDGQGVEAEVAGGNYVGYVPSYGLADAGGFAPAC